MLRRTMLSMLLSAPMALAADEKPDCIEAVVLARFIEYRPGPLDHSDPDLIIMSWTWDVDIEVREVYLGRIRSGRLTIGATLHTRFDHELHQPVLFLTGKFGSWYLAHVEFAARNAEGSWVLPIFEAPVDQELSPQGWMPHDYARWLRPVRYRASDVAGFGDGYENQPDGEDQWMRMRQGRRTAKRGIRVADIPAMLKERRSVDCAREQ